MKDRATPNEANNIMIGFSREDLERMFYKIAAERERKASVATRDFKVDRSFLAMNFRWTRRKIEKMEADGTLRPVFTGNDCARHYSFHECLEIYLSEND